MTQIPEQLRERTAGARFLELDGLRGIAAFTVILHHFCCMYDLKEKPYLLPLVAGHSAVLLFFVLSGFVLSLPFWNKGTFGRYDAYLVRRIFRIYVPYVAAVGLAAVGMLLVGEKHLPLAPWYYETWQHPLSFSMIRHHLMMSVSFEMNTAFWSLHYEMLMSILFPALLLVVRLIPFGVCESLILILYGISVTLLKHGIADPLGLGGDVKFAMVFLFGALLARHRAAIHRLWNRAGKLATGVFAVVSCMAYWGYVRSVTYRGHFPDAPEIILVLGAGGVLLSSLYSRRLSAFMKNRVAEYLGRVSYSLYLVHGTVLFFLVDVLYWKISWEWMLVLFVIVSLVLAHLFCVLIEEPALRVGKRLSAKLAK